MSNSENLKYLVQFEADTGDLDKAADAANELGEAVDKLSDEDVDIDVEDRKLEDAERAAKDLARSLENVGDADRAIRVLNSELDNMEAEIKGTARTADALKAALGDAFDGDSGRLNAMVADLRNMGLTFEQIEAKAKEFADVIQRADQVKLDGVNAGLKNVSTSLDGVRSSADQSRSVFANFTGNAAAELPGVSGAFGPLNMAISQFSEYASEGNIRMGEMAKLGGVMAAVGITFAAISNGVKLMGEEARASKARIEDLREAMEGGKVTATDLLEVVSTNPDALKIREEVTVSWNDFGDVLQEILPMIGGGFDDINIADIFDRADISLSQFSRTIVGTTDDLGNLTAELLAARDAGLITDFEFESAMIVIERSIKDVADAEREAAKEAKAFAVSLDDANVLLGDIEQGADPFKRYAREWSALVADVADGRVDFEASAETINTLAEATGMFPQDILAKAMEEGAAATEAQTEAAREAAEALQAMNDEMQIIRRNFDEIDDQAAAFATAMDRASELDDAQEMIDFSAGIRGIGDALAALSESGTDLTGLDLIPESWDEVQNMPDELRDVVDAVAGFSDSVSTEMSQAFESGGAEGVRVWAADTRRAIENEMLASGNYTRDQIDQIVGALNLLPGQVEVSIAIANSERARNIVDGLSGVISGLPEETQLKIATIVEDNPVMALGLAIEEMQRAGVQIPAEIIPILEEIGVTVSNYEAPPIVVPTTADIEGAAEVIAALDPDAIVMETDADDGAAEAVEAQAKKKYSEAIIVARAHADVAEARLETVANRSREAIIVARAHADVADDRLNTVANRDRTAHISVNVGSINLPSHDDLVREITGGRMAIRIPVDTFPRFTARIDGSRGTTGGRG